jgi:hypothetical protein
MLVFTLLRTCDFAAAFVPMLVLMLSSVTAENDPCIASRLSWERFKMW